MDLWIRSCNTEIPTARSTESRRAIHGATAHPFASPGQRPGVRPVKPHRALEGYNSLPHREGRSPHRLLPPQAAMQQWAFRCPDLASFCADTALLQRAEGAKLHPAARADRSRRRHPELAHLRPGGAEARARRRRNTIPTLLVPGRDAFASRSSGRWLAAELAQAGPTRGRSAAGPGSGLCTAPESTAENRAPRGGEAAEKRHSPGSLHPGSKTAMRPSAPPGSLAYPNRRGSPRTEPARPSRTHRTPGIPTARIALNTGAASLRGSAGPRPHAHVR